MKNTSGKKNIKTFLLNFSKGETISNLKIKKKNKKGRRFFWIASEQIKKKILWKRDIETPPPFLAEWGGRDKKRARIVRKEKFEKE